MFFIRALQRMNDNYTHIDENLFYITENIMGPPEVSAEYEQLLNDFNSQYNEHCTCSEICSQETCKCLQKSCVENYLTCQENPLLKHKMNDPEAFPVFECSDSCGCSTECGNRVVQKGPLEGLEIRKCDKGFGLFATSCIPSGTFICEYAGEIITTNQASKRHHNNKALGKRNYIFYLRELSSKQHIVTIIDPSIFGNIGRYINHSCEPNCHVVPVRCGNPIPKLAIFANVEILPNEEITFDYGLDDNFNLYTVSDRTTCLCKTESCRGFMPYHMY